MSSLVVELQHDALNHHVKLTDLLRKALVIAHKLDVSDFRRWIENELTGYREAKDLPTYRTIGSGVMAQDRYGRWVPVLFQDDSAQEAVSKFSVLDPVAEIESLVERASRDSGGSLRVGFTPDQEAILARGSENGLVRHARFSRVEDLKGILDVVKTEILKWSLKLEKDGILGEGMTFSRDEQRKASANHYTTNFFGAVGNVSQHSHDFVQSSTVGIISTPDLAKLVNLFTDHLDELQLGERERARAVAQIAALRAELTGEPDQTIVRHAGGTLRNITEGTIASLIAAGVQPALWDWVQHTMATFFK